MLLQRLINSKLNRKLFFYKGTLINQLTLISDKKFEDESKKQSMLMGETGQTEDFMLYNRVSKSYNKLNDAATLGLHRFWRRTVINNIAINENSQILDSPGGTGLNTMRLLEKTKTLKANSNFCITVYDINPAMMKIGQEKLKMLDYNKKFVRWIEGDIQKLPFEDGSFDAYLMFFGIRQNIDLNQVFKEANRVLKPNGKIVIGEFCYTKYPAMSQWLYVKFLQCIGSKMMNFLANEAGPSMFLLKNVINMPSRNQTIKMLEDVGFKHIQFKPMSWKIAGMYVGYKV